jgi:hypothetical protein
MDLILQPWQRCFVILAGWINRQQQEVTEYLVRESADPALRRTSRSPAETANCFV